MFGCVFWSFCYFRFLHPFLSRDWEKAECQVLGVRETLFSTRVEHKYLEYKLGLRVKGSYVTGYSCESSHFDDNYSESSANKVYPYEYDSYENWNFNQFEENHLILPRWLCGPYEKSLRFKQSVKCRWWINNKDKGVLEVSEYPPAEKPYVEVLLKDHPVVPEEDYYFIMIFGLGFLTVLPLFLIVFVLIPLKHAQKIKTFCLVNIINKRKHTKRVLKEFSVPSSQKLAVFLYVYDNLKTTKMRFSCQLLQKIAKYYSTNN